MDRKTQRVLYSAFAEEEVGIVATGEAICYPYRATSSPSAIDFEIFKSFRQQQMRVNVLTEDRGGLWLKKEDEKKRQCNLFFVELPCPAVTRSYNQLSFL